MSVYAKLEDGTEVTDADLLECLNNDTVTLIYKDEMSELNSKLIEYVDRLSRVLSLNDAIQLTAAAFNVPVYVLLSLIPVGEAS